MVEKPLVSAFQNFLQIENQLDIKKVMGRNVWMCFVSTASTYMTLNALEILMPSVTSVNIYVSLHLRVQNQRKKWNFPLNFRTMRKLSDLYSGIFQTQSSGCVSGLDHFRNFTNLKILNI